jgi:hypothetical protein
MERKDKRIHPEDVGAGSSGGKRRRHAYYTAKSGGVEKNRSRCVSRLRREYGVGQSTICDIKAQKNQILQFVAESDSMASISKRKALHGPQNNTDLDKVVYEWFCQLRSEGIPIFGPMLMEKAKSYHEELKIDGDCDYSMG